MRGKNGIRTNRGHRPGIWAPKRPFPVAKPVYIHPFGPPQAGVKNPKACFKPDGRTARHIMKSHLQYI